MNNILKLITKNKLRFTSILLIKLISSIGLVSTSIILFYVFNLISEGIYYLDLIYISLFFLLIIILIVFINQVDYYITQNYINKIMYDYRNNILKNYKI